MRAFFMSKNKCNTTPYLIRYLLPAIYTVFLLVINFEMIYPSFKNNVG